jgi:hypothetical protein
MVLAETVTLKISPRLAVDEYISAPYKVFNLLYISDIVLYSELQETIMSEAIETADGFILSIGI